MKPDVTINEVSMLSLGWLRETVNFPTPQSQSNAITVPGRNSPIRFNEALGRVAYPSRSFDMTFSMLGDRADYNRLVSTVVNQFAGQLCQVTVAVIAPEEERIRRLMKRDGISREYAMARIQAQHPDSWFRDRCTFCLENQGTAQEFRSQCLAFLQKIGIIE